MQALEAQLSLHAMNEVLGHADEQLLHRLVARGHARRGITHLAFEKPRHVGAVPAHSRDDLCAREQTVLPDGTCEVFSGCWDEVLPGIDTRQKTGTWHISELEPLVVVMALASSGRRTSHSAAF